MSELPHAWLLRLLKVNPHPRLPESAQRVFRAAPAYLLYRRVLLGLKHVSVVAGAMIAWVFFSNLYLPVLFSMPYGRAGFYAVEALAWLSFLVLLPVSFFIVRLDYELRWYVLSDRSLRIREGVMALREKTMTFANIQQISIRQNPLQRVLGIADVMVETAGGGSGSKGADAGHDAAEHLHEARFRGVSDAEAIRDIILACVRQHRDTGLGEPSEVITTGEPASTATPTTLEAARELLAEVRELRGSLARRPAPVSVDPPGS